MALLTPQNVPITGLSPATFTAVNSSDTIPRRPNLILVVANNSGAAITATIVVPGTRFGQPLADVDVSVAVGDLGFIFMEDFQALADPTSKVITVNYSATASVTAALLEHI